MEAKHGRQPAAPTQAGAKQIAITLYAPDDDNDNPRLLRLVLSAEDGSVLAAIEDGAEDGALMRAGFTECAPGPYFYVDAREYERVLERWAPAGSTSS
jgi:hypothetical protein